MQSVSHLYNVSKNRLIGNTDFFYKEKFSPVYRFISLFSEKQTVRPDSALTCCRQVVPYLKQKLAQEWWKTFFISKSILNISEDISLKNDILAIEALNRLESAIENNNGYSFNLETTVQGDKVIQDFYNERDILETFLAVPLTESQYFKLNGYLCFSRKEKLWKTLKNIKEIFLPVQENCVESIQKKIHCIENLLNLEITAQTDVSAGLDNKLTPQDVRLLMVASARKKTLETLNHFQIRYPHSTKLYDQWKKLEALYDSETCRHLQKLCMKGYVEGHIFFYDWSFNTIRDFFPLGFQAFIKHILYSRITHVAIVVKNFQNRVSLSHVNGATNNHALHPVQFPLLSPFGNFGELDISPLIPPDISLEHRLFLQKFFLDTFTKLASEEHPNIILEWKLLLTLFFGHKSLSAHDLSEVNLTDKQTQMCSSYIGVVFLKTIEEVNRQISALGYKEQIKHPFGNHEIIDRVDILRLLFHWKQLKIFKAVPHHPLISKIFTTSTL